MKKLTTIEQTIVTDNVNNAQPVHRKTFGEMLKFWSIFDLIYKTNHRYIVETIYSPYECKQTNVHKSMKVFVSERTLTRYRKNYLTCYFAYFNWDEQGTRS